MKFTDLFSNQFKMIEENPNITRSPKILYEIHSEIKKIASENTSYKIISLPDSEYHFKSELGNKKVDIAIVDEKTNELKGAIMFKAVRSEYNKNANNYYENMKGESSLFLDNNIPIYQIIFIPTKVKHKKSDGKLTYEIPNEVYYKNYNNFINSNCNNYWKKLKLGVYYFDIDYDKEYTTQYSTKKISNIEDTLTEGIINFMKGLE